MSDDDVIDRRLGLPVHPLPDPAGPDYATCFAWPGVPLLVQDLWPPALLTVIVLILLSLGVL
jgi:hypothetical protein